MRNITVTILFALGISFILGGCSATRSVMVDGEKVKLKACPKDYMDIQSSYKYSDGIMRCYNKRDNTVMEFISGETLCTVSVLSPNNSRLVSSAAYGSDRKIQSINYYDNITGQCNRIIGFDGEAKVSSIATFNTDNMNTTVEYYPDGKTKSVGGDGLDRISFYPDGAVEKYFVYENNVPAYSFEYSSDGKPRVYTKHFGPSNTPSKKGDIFGFVMRTVLAVRPIESVSFDEDGNIDAASDFKWSGLASLDEYSNYGPDGAIRAYGCRKGDCLKYNKGKEWKCGAEGEPCSKISKNLGYKFDNKDVSGILKSFPDLNKLNSGAEYPGLCEIAPQAFQCM